MNVALRSSRVVEGIGPLKPGNQRDAPGANSGGRATRKMSDVNIHHHIVVVFCSSSPAQGPKAMTRTSRRPLPAQRAATGVMAAPAARSKMTSEPRSQPRQRAPELSRFDACALAHPKR